MYIQLNGNNKITFMKFIDYLFYRVYMCYNKTNDIPMFKSVIFVSAILVFSTSFIWVNTLLILHPNIETKYYGLFSFLPCLPIYFRYHKKISILKRKYKDSKYNKTIPDWFCLYGMFTISLAIGITLGISGHLFLEYLGIIENLCQ